MGFIDVRIPIFGVDRRRSVTRRARTIEMKKTPPSHTAHPSYAPVTRGGTRDDQESSLELSHLGHFRTHRRALSEPSR